MKKINEYLKNLIKDFSSLTFHLSPPHRGQALITLIFFSIIAMTITAAAISVMFSNSLNATRFQQGSVAYEVAQSGVENAILRLIRDSSYTGETLTVGNGTAVIQVTHNSTAYTITSTGTVGNFVRKIEADGTYSNNQFIETSRKEVY